jgi:hypothetical protein
VLLDPELEIIGEASETSAQVWIVKGFAETFVTEDDLVFVANSKFSLETVCEE